MIADDQDGGRAWLGGARHSTGARAATNRLTLHVRDLAPGEGVLMTTYHSDGHEIATGAPFIEVRTTADNHRDLLDELWSALTPELRIFAGSLRTWRARKRQHSTSSASSRLIYGRRRDAPPTAVDLRDLG